MSAKLFLKMDYSSDNLEQAVFQFYQSDSVTQAQAHQYLTAAKCSPQAWAFVWELLQPQKATEVQFFGATTLHTKIEKSLNELTAEEIVGLRERLLSSIASCTGAKIVLNRLCLSLSAYLLHTCPDRWPDAISALLNTFTPSRLPNTPPSKVIWVLLEILTLIPEEFSCMHFTSHQKGILRHELEKNIPQVIELLENVLSSQQDQEVTVQAANCVASWSTLGMPLTQCQNLVNLLSALIFSYHKINPSICEKSLDALCAICSHPLAIKYPNHLLDMLRKILPLREIIAREYIINPQEPDQELVKNVYTLLITFGETHSQLLIEWLKVSGAAQDDAMALITALLHCSGAQGSYPVNEVHSRLAFSFWYILQDHVVTCEEPVYMMCMKLLGPIYRELVNVLICKAQLPPEDQPMSLDDAELFRCYRQDIGDTMMYCYSILSDSTLSIIKNRVEKYNTEVSPWQEIEASLFSLCSIAENVDLEEAKYLPTLFQYIRQLPFDRLDPRVLSTALDTIGAYAEWIAANGATLEHILPLIPLGLNVLEAAPSATMALKDLTRDCQEAIRPYSSVILDASQEILHSGRLKLNEGLRLMYSVGRLLSTLPAESLFPSMEVVITPYFTQLATLSHQEPRVEVKNNILTCLKMIGTLTAALDTRQDNSVSTSPQPALLILHKLLPILKDVAAVWGRDPPVMQALYTVLKHAVVNLLDDSEPAVGDILELIVTSYRFCPEPGALDLARQLCILFGKEDKCLVAMQSLMSELCTVTLNKVSASAANLSDCTDLLQEFFTLLSQIVKKIPRILTFGSSSDCVPLFQCATISLGMPELPAVKAATFFLVNFITQSRELPQLSNVVNVCGEQLVHKVIALVGGEASRSNIEPLADILLALNKKYCDNHARWLHQAVTDVQCPQTSPQQRDNFIKVVLRECSNKRKLQEHVREFSLICRGLIGNEIVRTTAVFS